MQFFKHDTGAHKDSKILSLRIDHGGAAVDAYYAILERLYDKETSLVIEENRAETKGLCLLLNLDFETLQAYVSTMVAIGLLDAQDNGEGHMTAVHSPRAKAEISKCAEQHERAVQNGKKGGRPKGAKTKRKPRKTQGLSSANQERTEKNQTKDYKTVLDSHKGYPNTGAEHGADAGKPAPRSARECRGCGGAMQPTNSYAAGTRKRIWRCGECGGEEALDE